MSQIMSEARLHFFPLIALFIFLGVFAWAMWRVFRPGSRRELEAASRVVLDDTTDRSKGSEIAGGGA